MSRIQNILEKAERDGVIRRHPGNNVPEWLPATAAAPPLQAFIAPSSPVAPNTAAEPASEPGHTVRSTALHPRLVAALTPTARTAEQYRALRTRILNGDGGMANNVVLITSPARGDGKSLTTANLGLTMAQERDHRVCIVDADLRSPQMHTLFGLPAGPGLSDVLAGHASIDDALVHIEEHNICVLPAGPVPRYPAELLGTATMRHALDVLRSRFDRVIVDTPAAVPLADVGVLTPLVDCVVLIVRAGITSKPAILDAVSTMDTGKLLGVVLNQTE